MLRASESLRELLIHLSTETRISRGKRQRATFAGHHQIIKSPFIKSPCPHREPLVRGPGCQGCQECHFFADLPSRRRSRRKNKARHDFRPIVNNSWTRFAAHSGTLERVPASARVRYPPRRVPANAGASNRHSR